MQYLIKGKANNMVMFLYMSGTAKESNARTRRNSRKQLIPGELIFNRKVVIKTFFLDDQGHV